MEVTHPLFGARLRVNRAKMPIRSIKRHMQKWADLHWEHIELELDEQGHARMDPDGTVRHTQTHDLPIEILAKTSLWIGETIYNLRGALDYLVYALALAGSKGEDVKGTQFPIESNMDNFTGRITGVHPKTKKPMQTYLHHVPPVAVRRIMQLQPCWKPPCLWTPILRDLSNPDKHRFLTELRSRAIVVAGLHPLIEEVPLEARVHPHLVVEVLFRKSGLDVIDTLEMLQREVSAVIQEFEPVFERRT